MQSSPDSQEGRSEDVFSCTGVRTNAAALSPHGRLMKHAWPLTTALRARRRLTWSFTAARPQDARLDARDTRDTLLASLALVLPDLADHTEPTGDALQPGSQAPRGPPEAEEAAQVEATLRASQSGSLSLLGLEHRDRVSDAATEDAPLHTVEPLEPAAAARRWAVSSWGRGL